MSIYLEKINVNPIKNGIFLLFLSDCLLSFLDNILRTLIYFANNQIQI